MLDGQAATPLYIQLMEQIEHMIETGEYKPGDRLPSEAEIAKNCGVSIITVRKAVGALSEKELVARKQGKGTFVTKPKFTKDIKQLHSFTQMCESIGVKPGGQTLENKIMVPENKVLEGLGLAEDSQVVHISRIRLADQEPVSLEHSYFSLKYAFLLGENLENKSLFQALKAKADVEVAISEKRIGICRATSKEAELLKVKKNDPLLFIKSVAYTREHEPIYYGIQIYSGERFAFYVNETIL